MGVDNLEDKRRSWESRAMRSRARNTYKTMLETVPRVYNSLFLTVVFLFKQLLTKDSYSTLSETDFNSKIKDFKKALKAAENISSNVDSEKNKWEESEKHCDALNMIIFKLT